MGLLCGLASTKSGEALHSQQFMGTKTAAFMPFLRASRITTALEWLRAILIKGWWLGVGVGGGGGGGDWFCAVSLAGVGGKFDGGEDGGGTALLQLAKVCCSIASIWPQVCRVDELFQLNFSSANRIA